MQSDIQKSLEIPFVKVITDADWQKATWQFTLSGREFWSEEDPGAQITHTHPVPDVEETLLTGQVKHQQESHGISEESCSEAAEPENTWKYLLFSGNKKWNLILSI